MINIEDILGQLEPNVSLSDIFVSVYSVDRCYGGPEEGGWWYDQYSLEGSRKCRSKEEAEKIVEKLQIWADKENKENEPEKALRMSQIPEGPDPFYDTEGYIPIGSSDGGDYQIILEQTLGMHTTTGRPVYE